MNFYVEVMSITEFEKKVAAIFQKDVALTEEQQQAIKDLYMDICTKAENASYDAINSAQVGAYNDGFVDGQNAAIDVFTY